MRHLSLAVLVVVFAVLAVPAAHAGIAESVDRPEAPVIRISVEIVQLDAIVTDRHGRHVTDLKPADFEVFQDGKRQEISRFAYFHVRSSRPGGASGTEGDSALPSEEANGDASAPARTLAVVVDDLSFSPHSFARMRRALGRALPRLASSDRVAIVATGRRNPDFAPTTDRAANLSALAGLRRTPWRREATGGERYDGGSFGDWTAQLVMKSMSVVKETIRSMQSLPGRKALILVSEGFSGLGSGGNPFVHDLFWPVDRLYGDADDLLGAWKRLGDFAARAGVVVYAIDPRGLVTGGLNAEDSVPGATAHGMLGDALLSRRVDIHRSQGTLQYLAEETGGLALLDRNDLEAALASITDDLSGYYLIGYQPAPDTFAGSGFRDIDIKVMRPGLKVRTRKGFFPVTDAQVAAALQ